jgi:hypothetical protein
MRPGQIRVFDGLRVTTEHVDHFQASLHSAIQDIREILGLGVVYAGLEVVATGSDIVTVQPGIAFDRQKNRIVCDEAQQLKVAFAPKQDALYVCAKYDQIEGGETEGRKTLIWDSCSVSLRSDRPDPKENVLPLAMVTRSDSGSLAVTDLTAPVVAGTAAPEPRADAGPQPADWTVRQGVLRLPENAGAAPASVSSLLSSAAAGAPPPGTGGVPWVPLAAVELPADLAWSGATCYATVSATLNLPAAPAAPAADAGTPGGAEPGTAASAAPVRVDATFRASSTGEATIVDGRIAQFAVTTNGVTPGELTEGVVFSLPLDAAASAVLADARELLARVRLCIRLESSGGTAIKAVAHLTWSGAWTDQAAQQFEQHRPMLTWTGRLAWKAVGRPAPVTANL